MKKLAMLLVASLLMACGGGGVTGPDTSDIPDYYTIYYQIEFDSHGPKVPPYVWVGDLVLHDDKTLEISLRPCSWDEECQNEEGEGTWQRRDGGLRICSDPSIASTPWLYGLEVHDESCLTFFWDEPCCEGKSGTWLTRDLDPRQWVKSWLSLERGVTVLTEEE
jgi:hypothetical protein